MTHVNRVLQLLLLAAAACAATYFRAALSPIQESLRESLAFTDNQIALLQGMAAAVPTALASVPLGFFADRFSRARMLRMFLTLAVISCFLTALASSFGLLYLARCLVGLTLPGIIVAVYSAAADLFPPGQRGRASMVIGIGEISGTPAAFALGGSLLVWVGSTPAMKALPLALHDWSWALLWMGVLLTPLVPLMLLVREPERTSEPVKHESIAIACRKLWRYRSVAAPLQLGRATVYIADGAVVVWGAPLLARKFHMPADHIGAVMSGALLAAGLLGPLLGGPLVDFCRSRGGPRRAVQVLGIIALLGVPVALFPLMATPSWVGIALGIFLTLGFTISAASVALALVVIPSELRGFNLGISIVVGSLFFSGIAPLTVSGLSGWIGGEAMLDRALAIVCSIASLLNAAVLTLSARKFP